jgi:uncharacterized protein
MAGCGACAGHRATVGRTLAGMGIRMAAVDRHRDEIRAIASRHRALSVSVFGSVARGDDGPDSDIDFLVEFAPGASLLDLMRIQDDLESLLGGRIDVVSAGGLKDRDEHIRREAVLV